MYFLAAWEGTEREREEHMQGGMKQARTEWVIINFDFKRLILTWCSLRGLALTGGE